jgi:inner membrane protein
VAAAALAVIVAADLAISRLDPPLLVVGLLDWPAHLATTLVLALALPRLPEEVLLGAFAASVAIDLDHVPLLLGSDAFDGDLERPYTHALWTLVLVGAAGLALRRLRPRAQATGVALGATLGLASHLARDLATGPGLSLLWPASDAVARVPWAAYAVVLGMLALVVAARAAARA